jgi:hypothetical protein
MGKKRSCSVEHGEVDLPSGSAPRNFWAKGTRSLFGKLCTNRRVYSVPIAKKHNKSVNLLREERRKETHVL